MSAWGQGELCTRWLNRSFSNLKGYDQKWFWIFSIKNYILKYILKKLTLRPRFIFELTIDIFEMITYLPTVEHSNESTATAANLYFFIKLNDHIFPVHIFRLSLALLLICVSNICFYRIKFFKKIPREWFIKKTLLERYFTKQHLPKSVLGLPYGPLP